MVKILVLFLKQFRDLKFNKSLLDKGFDSIMPVSLTFEGDFQLPANIERLVTSIIEKGIPEAD